MTQPGGASTEPPAGQQPTRVEQLQTCYKKNRSTDESSDYEWRWYGRWWDREKFVFEPFLSECYCENGFHLIRQEILHNWRLLDTSDTVPPEMRYICAYHTVIERLCRNIRDFGPLPRSKPTYYVAAARYPVGVVLHGQKLRTGERLQLVPKIEYNTPIWMFIGACIHKILVLGEKEEPTQKEGAGHRHWMKFIKGIRKTLELLHKKGLTKLLPIENITKSQIQEMNKYLAGDSTVGKLEKEIIKDIHTVFCGEPPKNRSCGQIAEYGEYMAHVPHMFEWYLRKTVCDMLEKHNKGAEYEVVEKRGFSYPRREKFSNQVEPDIVIWKNGETNGRWVACIDAKLKKREEKQKSDMHQMAVYTEALERDNAREMQQGESIRGVVFVAVYGQNKGVDDTHDECPVDGEIRFMFCHLHRQCLEDGMQVAKDVDDEMQKQVERALQFLGLIELDSFT